MEENKNEHKIDIFRPFRYYTFVTEVLKAMEPYFIEKYGNASSLHTMGQVARQAIEDSRKKDCIFFRSKARRIDFYWRRD
jgi:cysteine sulfinate desulfinase/cysteine desulfurase-like protein